MAHEFPNSRFQGFDFSEEAIRHAHAGREWELDNVTFEVRDVTDLSLTAAFDFITTFDAVHDQAAPTGSSRASPMRCVPAACTSAWISPR